MSKWDRGIVVVLAALALPARAGDPLVERKAEALLDAALGATRAQAPAPGRALFERVLQSDAFVGQAVGPLDVHVRLADGLKRPKEARRVLEQAVAGLEPVAGFLARNFGRAQGLVSGRRLRVVLASSDLDGGQEAFSELLALLDLCEDGGFSGWKPDLPVFSAANARAAVVGTWEVLLFNLQHEEARDARPWLGHGLGYHALNTLSNLLLACGAYGPVPPWLQQGLADELDIAAYGQAWVASAESTEFSWRRGGWRSTGWEGFLPEGTHPPPPVYEPPPPLSVSFQHHVADDGWIARGESATRHWSKLAGDLRSEAPPSLRRAAAVRDDAPRDRAYGRLVLHLLLQPGGRPEGAPGLLEALDVRPPPVLGGIRPGEPLTALFARVLGGVPELQPLEQETLEQQLVAAGRPEAVATLRSLKVEGLLSLNDHREQSAWLYRQKLDPRARQQVFNLIVEAERLQQLREWEVLGAALDRAAWAALATSKGYPRDAARLGGVLAAFRNALAQPAGGAAGG